MKTLIIATTNPAKIAQMQDALASLDITVEGVADKRSLPEVVEDGATVQENARKKATVYAATLGQLVLSLDNALFFHGLAPEKQPGMHVRRVPGKDRLTDEELLERGIALVNSLGGRATGYWEYGVCIADPGGNRWETTVQTDRVFTNTPSKSTIPGYPLESIQLNPETGVYVSDMSPDERAAFWQHTLGAPLCAFVTSVITQS